MSTEIESILFDIGGTLQASRPSGDALKRDNVRQIHALVNADTVLDEFGEVLTSRAAAYRRWAKETRSELNEFDLWTRWMLPEYPAELLAQKAVQVNQLWREAVSTHVVLPQSKDLLVELFRRGYRLGIVSNTSSSVEVPRLLRELEIGGLLETVVLSCVVGIRKPAPGILLEATRRMHVEPGKCVYVGDRHDRDVLAARQAGFSGVILVRGVDATTRKEPDLASSGADYYIDDVRELLDIFPPRKTMPAAQPVYEISCSTAWAQHNVPTLSDFFEATRRLGFKRVELNHQVDSAMLKGLDLHRLPISSLHEPCPADIPLPVLKARDWLISSPDEECRRHGIEAVERCIDLAADLGLASIVVHAGAVSSDLAPEKELRRLYTASGPSSPDYLQRRAELMQFRSSHSAACLAAVKRSLAELLDYAAPFGIRLGIENRFHYCEIPTVDEMAELLALAPADRLGFIYDVGHAQHLDRLGFYAHEEWLRRYSSRIIEVHLHDVQGIEDHFAPGLGEVDFDMVARYLPDDALRTLEVKVTNTPQQVRDSLAYLAQHGCIRPPTN